ncbi:hypothetical protein Ddye_006983 [Dipteronia dyeriana]|uniref:Transposase-associated domain-containing protein n=1 Tax=Dipteronia dyeriana TaxID=168575 RepID=A0AAD9XJ56_9ROSI|nr:hypothetical protein Ddye_006983 [Dipteronia dyeriana]
MLHVVKCVLNYLFREVDMDKSWIDLPSKACMQYIEWVDKFLDFAFANIIGDTRIYCPCKKCCNRYLVERQVARAHIIVNDFFVKSTKIGPNTVNPTYLCIQVKIMSIVM